MAIKTYNDQNFVAIANAIRSKNGETTQYKPSEMAAAISAIESAIEVLPQDTVSGAIANFPDGSNNYPVVELIANIDPKQAGSGDPSPSNVRPISGSTEVNISHSKKNFYPIKIGNDSFSTNGGATYSSNNGELIINTVSTSSSCGVYINTSTSPLSATLKYFNDKGISRVISFTAVSTVANTPMRSTSGSTTSYTVGTTPKRYSVISTGVNCSFYAVSVEATITISDLMVEAGTVASDTYEPYSAPEVKTISWESEAGTVYGGTLNVTTGELTVTHTILTKNSADMDNTESYPGWKNSGIRDFIGSGIDTTYNNQILNVGSVFGANTLGSTNDILYLPKASYNNLSQSDWIALAIDVQIFLELAEPVTYQLEPEEIKTLLGVNNIYADTGNVSVTYRADIDLYIAKKIAEGA